MNRGVENLDHQIAKVELMPNRDEECQSVTREAITIIEDIRKQYLTVLQADVYRTLPHGVNIINRLADLQNMLEDRLLRDKAHYQE